MAAAVDFGTMVLAVELLHRSPVVGTVIGAACGAVTNFVVSRVWIFQARAGHPLAQAARYAFVSGASLGLNAAGVYVLTHRIGVYYVAARVLVSVAVSLLWNFPLQRHFTFRVRKLRRPLS